ncbi:MAG: HEAT repeat domain-containing protein [Bacteroidales bacterium]|nr:HEAT repeat domain-containing protein [Bacteroidales bacterium]
MSYPIRTKIGTLAILAAGLFALTAAPDLAAASKEKDAQRYIQILRTSNDPVAVAKALDELGKLGQIYKPLATPAIPDFMTALKHPDAKIRAAAAESLGMIDADPKEVVPALLKLLNSDSDEKVKIAAAKGLGSMGDKAKPASKDLRELSKTDELRKTKLGRAAQDAMRSINRRPNE